MIKEKIRINETENEEPIIDGADTDDDGGADGGTPELHRNAATEPFSSRESITYSDGCFSLSMSSCSLSFDQLGEKFVRFWKLNVVGKSDGKEKGENKNYVG